MNSNKHNIPSLASHNAAYNTLLRKAKTRNERDKILTYQPALITFRKNLLEKMQRDNYRLEHEKNIRRVRGARCYIQCSWRSLAKRQVDKPFSNVEEVTNLEYYY